MEEVMEEVQNLFETFKNDESCFELDISSYDIEEIPYSLFNLPTNRLKFLILDHNILTSLPFDINKLVMLRKLSIVGNELTELSHSFSSLLCLEELNLNENLLTVLPSDIGKLQSLQIFSAIGNNLRSLPPSITQLESLKELHLDENKISYLPSKFSGLKSLIVLDILNNCLEELPIDIGSVKTLQILNCNGNLLRSLPDSFSNLLSLKFLDLGSNNIDELPETLSCAKTIEKLFLENNMLKIVPLWFHELQNLEELSIHDNELQHQPFDNLFCKSCLKLKKLEAGANFIFSLPPHFGSLTNLDYLHLGSTKNELERSHFQNGNWITTLPDSFCELFKLKKLNINENQIELLPLQFGELKSLTWLDLGQNMLRVLPPSFCELTNLEFLQLSKNMLMELPENFGNLKNLKDLRLDNNCLKKLPISIENVLGLQCLDLFHNNLTEMPMFVFKLKKIIRLDLDQNLFQLSIANVPKILPSDNYPVRDPSLKDNWRGKSRYKKMSENVIDFKYPENEGENDTQKEIEWNFNALQNAMRQGTAMWRSHSNAEPRELFSRDRKTEVSNDEWIAMNFNVLLANKNKPKVSNPDEEDWDSEIENNKNYNSVINVCSMREAVNSNIIDDFQNSVNRYPPACQAYTSVASYDSFVYKKCEQLKVVSKNFKSFEVIEGQFDDC
ncbi:leucine-rich repeat protein lrrA isoform X2 [Hydra vulgaris]|uniref:Leucine-rich repeat protein lrrA isoform X2 n=1 Tax=Hydra vulgaris TaxID=6087 RepID=A0ABM4CDL6_HYDVU